MRTSSGSAAAGAAGAVIASLLGAAPHPLVGLPAVSSVGAAQSQVHRAARVLLVTLFALTLAACGSATATSPPPLPLVAPSPSASRPVTAPPSPDATVSPSPVATNVTMDTEASLPAVITVTAGTTVTWTDPSTEPHNVIAADNSFASLIL